MKELGPLNYKSIDPNDPYDPKDLLERLCQDMEGVIKKGIDANPAVSHISRLIRLLWGLIDEFEEAEAKRKAAQALWEELQNTAAPSDTEAVDLPTLLRERELRGRRIQEAEAGFADAQARFEVLIKEHPKRLKAADLLSELEGILHDAKQAAKRLRIRIWTIRSLFFALAIGVSLFVEYTYGPWIKQLLLHYLAGYNRLLAVLVLFLIQYFTFRRWLRRREKATYWRLFEELRKRLTELEERAKQILTEIEDFANKLD